MGRLLAVAVACALVGVASPAAAQEEEKLGFKRVSIDHVEAAPSILHELVRLRLYVSAIDLESAGAVLPIVGHEAWTLEGGPALKNNPYLAGVYSGTVGELAIVFVVETTRYDETILQGFKDAIREELLVPLEGRSHTQVAVVSYGGSDVTSGRLTKVSAAIGQIDELVTDGEMSEEPQLVAALDRAVRLLRKAKPTVEGTAPSAIRRLIIVVSDGRTEDDDDRDAVTDVGLLADKHSIRIHTIGYAKDDTRRPLFALGEVSKRSHGSFRWIQTILDVDSVRLPFRRLRDEIQKQYVLTTFVPKDEVPAKVSVSGTFTDRELESNVVKVPVQICGEDECRAGQWCSGTRCISRRAEEGRGFFGWLFLLVGIGIGGFALLVGVGFTITKLKERKEKEPIDPDKPKKPVPVPGAAAAPPAAAPLSAAPIAGPQLYIMSGPQAGHRVALFHGFTIGKAPGSNLSLEHDGFASSHHAQILMDAAGHCQIVDQSSTNGTYINGVRITTERLFDGMSIRCGSTELRFLQA